MIQYRLPRNQYKKLIQQMKLLLNKYSQESEKLLLQRNMIKKGRMIYFKIINNCCCGIQYSFVCHPQWRPYQEC
ncbi:hypothetical protein C922_02028 [Plasmodium inui San Antonio 1]|uniref:Uncharacterized protein n=1 Tax=Plasmodium inui San Antonio 1 TaxID=1237626 RepID=W7AFL3_9APIC|nr:hypothetical protein C922_02028 [Plasmodium inui San Antonio 1]EUD67839.1 hypothetical protein C922_02028 [Plasmodium inui San Antonio 1]